MVSRSQQRLCCLCEFPVADGGVPLDALDAGKWDEWCRRELGEELHNSPDAEQVLVTCQYCIWEARLAHESSLGEWSEKEKGCDWWMGHDDDHFFREYFYKTTVIRPCKVVLKKISSDFDHLTLENIAVKDCSRINSHKEAEVKNFQTSTEVEKQPDIKSADDDHFFRECSYKTPVIRPCKVVLEKISSDFDHLTLENIAVKDCSRINSHKEAEIKICQTSTQVEKQPDIKSADGKSTKICVFRCKNYQCSTYFLTEDQRKQHEQKFHLNGALNKTVKCIYCSALITSGKLYYHIKRQHKEAFVIKCDGTKACPYYFHAEIEKKDHIFNEHTTGLHHKSTPVKCIIYCNKICKNNGQLQRHVYNFRKDVRIKCRVKGCVIYFLGQKESDEHFLQVHQHAESLKNPKHHLRNHLHMFLANKANMKFIFKCPQCPEYFHAKVHLKEHLRNIHAARCY